MGGFPPLFHFFPTHVAPPNTAVRAAPVSVWRLIVVTWLAEWAVFVGSCDRARGSASGVRLLYATGYNILGWPLHGLTCGLPASAAVPCAVVYIRLSYVNKSISVCLASAGAPRRDHSVPLYKMIPVSPDLLSVGGGTLHTISARFGTHSPARAISGEAEPECYPLTDFVG